MRGLRSSINTSVILITHDLGVIAEMADRVAVMYAGRIIEEANVEAIFDDPLHPYTQGLIASVPVLNQVKEDLDTIPGNVPNLVNLPEGCRFADRCELRKKLELALCVRKEPDLILAEKKHKVRCWGYQDDPESGHEAPLKREAVS
jgi:oligopeptide/dipeptide ABC transporter ATP-binding protein